MDSTELHLASESELSTLAGEILARAKEEQEGGRPVRVIALEGELGAGKTALVKECGRLLEVSEEITSPTFLVMRRYALSGAASKQYGVESLVHIDAYRVSSPELLDLGWASLLKDSKNLIFIEWADRVKEIIPPSATWVRLEAKGTRARRAYVTHGRA